MDYPVSRSGPLIGTFKECEDVKSINLAADGVLSLVLVLVETVRFLRVP